MHIWHSNVGPLKRRQIVEREIEQKVLRPHLFIFPYVSEHNAGDRSSVFEGLRGAPNDSHSSDIHGAGHEILPDVPGDTSVYDMAGCHYAAGNNETSKAVHQLGEFYICTDSNLFVLSYAR